MFNTGLVIAVICRHVIINETSVQYTQHQRQYVDYAARPVIIGAESVTQNIL